MHILIAREIHDQHGGDDDDGGGVINNVSYQRFYILCAVRRAAYTKTACTSILSGLDRRCAAEIYYARFARRTHGTGVCVLTQYYLRTTIIALPALVGGNKRTRGRPRVL